MEESTTKLLADAIISTPSANLQHEILRILVSHNSKVGTKSEDDFLSEQKLCGDKVNGNQCIKLLHACINSTDSQCQNAWSQLNWGAGIDWENMDHGAALNLAKKLGLDRDSVDTVVAKLTVGANKDASSSLKMSLQAIKNRISPSSSQIKPIAPDSQLGDVQKRTPVVLINKMEKTGGGLKCNYANFVRCVDAVKTNISMKGGSEHAIFLRNGLIELQQLLQHRSKTIEKNDLVRIKDLIDNLERIENRTQSLGMYITSLNSALKQDFVLIPDDKKEITLKLMEKLSDEANALKSSSISKTNNLVEIFEQLDNITRRLEKISS